MHWVRDTEDMKIKERQVILEKRRTRVDLSLVIFLHARKRHSYLLEKTLDVVACFGRCFHKHDVQLGRLGSRLFQCYLSIRAGSETEIIGLRAYESRSNDMHIPLVR